MQKHSHIKKLATVFLLCVFTLGLTPKKTLHNLLANHSDNAAKPGRETTQQVDKAGFNCKCDNLVAESNFIARTILIIPITLALHLAYTSYYSSFLSLPRLLVNLRGPPLKV